MLIHSDFIHWLICINVRVLDSFLQPPFLSNFIEKHTNMQRQQTLHTLHKGTKNNDVSLNK